ncbi:MAG: EAL domain-containing protein [Alphaproteobacteria bacterium]|nr:EAL domain-containing protein [Alphaproteobacteria bacterium]
MRNRIYHLLMLFAAIGAFVPVLAVDTLLDGYVRERESAKLQLAVEELANSSRLSVEAGIASLQRVINSSPTVCSPTFMRNARMELQKGVAVKQVAVTGQNGAQMCNALETELVYAGISQKIGLPGRNETLRVVSVAGQERPWFIISGIVRGNNVVSTLVLSVPRADFGMTKILAEATVVHVKLTNGTEIYTLGDSTPFDQARDRTAFVEAESIAGDIPVRVHAVVPFDILRLEYAGLDVSFTILASIFSAGILWLLLRLVQRSNNATFGLERAIQAGELEPRYQPIINLQTGAIEGCEVLIRWIKPNGEIIAPGSFIEYAEISGLAIPMTLALLEMVREDLEELAIEQPQLKIGINLFERHFSDGAIVNDVTQIFGGSAIKFDQLVFEITERQPLADVADANATIAALHDLGARVALDDAGTGHSNLAYLQTMGIDIIKIDKVFTDLITERSKAVPVIDAFIIMARDLNMEVVAEGVETREQALYLRGRGVTFAQGFLFSPAIERDAYMDMARKLNRQYGENADLEDDITFAA